MYLHRYSYVGYTIRIIIINNNNNIDIMFARNSIVRALARRSFATRSVSVRSSKQVALGRFSRNDHRRWLVGWLVGSSEPFVGVLTLPDRPKRDDRSSSSVTHFTLSSICLLVALHYRLPLVVLLRRPRHGRVPPGPRPWAPRPCGRSNRMIALPHCARPSLCTESPVRTKNVPSWPSNPMVSNVVWWVILLLVSKSGATSW